MPFGHGDTAKKAGATELSAAPAHPMMEMAKPTMETEMSESENEAQHARLGCIDAGLLMAIFVITDALCDAEDGPNRLYLRARISKALESMQDKPPQTRLALEYLLKHLGKVDWNSATPLPPE